MNFTTDLPKSRPFVTYIVASAVKCEKFFPNSKNEGPSFRMHAVILNKNGLNSYREKINRKENPDNLKNLLDITKSTKSEPEYILCHIRKIDVDYKISKPHKVHNDNISDDEKQKKKLRKGKLEDLEDTHSKNLEKEEIKEIEQEVKQTDNLQKNTDESLRFRKMNVNTFQMYCVNQVVERDFANLVNEFCKTPAKKVKIYKENFFQEVIDKELNKKESNERDYAKMFNLMS